MGQKLAAILNQLIDGQVSEDQSRQTIIEEMAQAAGIDADAVDSLLQGSSDSPPLEHLRGFVGVLHDASINVLKAAAGEDEKGSRQVAIKEVIPKEQYERLQQIKEALETALDS